ncbi:MAG: hypothetical protein ACOC82_02685, partial [Candidatus Bipolaricaulota bacterium]
MSSEKMVRLFLSMALVLFGIVLGFTASGEPKLVGEFQASLSTASRDCIVEYGSIVCTNVPGEEQASIPYFLENLLDLR